MHRYVGRREVERACFKLLGRLTDHSRGVRRVSIFSVADDQFLSTPIRWAGARSLAVGLGGSAANAGSIAGVVAGKESPDAGVVVSASGDEFDSSTSHSGVGISSLRGAFR